MTAHFRKLTLAAALLLPLLARAASTSDTPETNWPQWRGPFQNGSAPLANPPITWSDTENIRWNIPLPGEGSATPVIWNDKVFITATTGRNALPKRVNQSNSDEKCRWIVLCVERSTGRVLWERTAHEGPPLDWENEGRHNTLACYSPVTDGRQLYVSFGSAGVYCYDFEGNLRWRQELQPAAIKRHGGEGGSPVVYNGNVCLVWDHEGCAFLTAFDANTGKVLWKTARDERNSWFTPLVVEHNGEAQLVANGAKQIQSYELLSGRTIWRSTGLDGYSIPSPVAGHGLVFLMTGFAGNNQLVAIRLGRTGDLTATDAVAWRYNKNTSYIASPLLYEDQLYFIANNQNIITCLNATNGNPLIVAARLEGLREVYASPVGAGGRIYILDRTGHCAVLQKSQRLELLSLNHLHDKFDSSPAAAGGDLFLRGLSSLYCLQELQHPK